MALLQAERRIMHRFVDALEELMLLDVEQIGHIADYVGENGAELSDGTMAMVQTDMVATDALRAAVDVLVRTGVR